MTPTNQLASPLGKLTVFGLATECDDYCSLPTAPLTYTNTTIILEDADPNWGSSAVAGSQIYGDGTINTAAQKQTVVQGFESDQGGKVWRANEITVPTLQS